MQFVLSVFAFFLTLNSSFAQQVRMSDVNEPGITYGATSTSVTPHRTTPGDGTTQTGRFKTYLAIDSSADIDGSGSTPGAYHVSSSSLLPQATTEITDGVLDVVLTVRSNGATQYLTALVSNDNSTDSQPTDGNWIYYNPTSTGGAELAITSSTDVSIVARINLAELCEGDSGGANYFECNDFDGTNTQAFQVYFYLSTVKQTNGAASSENPTDSDLNHGIFLELNFSDNPPNGLAPTLDSIDRGDAGLTLNYNGSTITNFLEVRACSSTTDITADAGDPLENTGCADSGTAYDANTDSSIRVGNLTNGETYYFGVYFVDNFRFGTEISNIVSETPLEIETLLDTNQCFIATAAYGGDHTAVNFLRNFRDKILLQNDLGKEFVDLYYEYSPPIAKLIIQHPILKAIVRPIVHTIYLMLKYWWFFATLIVVFSVMVSMLMRLRIEEPNGGA